MNEPMPEETEEVQNTVKDILKFRNKPYRKQQRDCFDGPISLGSSLELREDFYAVCFLYWMKRKAILRDCEDSDYEEGEAVKESDDKVDKGDKASDNGSEQEEDEEPIDVWRTMFFQNRTDITGKLCFLVLCQILLILFLFKEALTNVDMVDALKTQPDGVSIVLCRFLCGIFLHINLSDELEQAMSLMKYSMNHPWKFRKWWAAYLVGAS